MTDKNIFDLVDQMNKDKDQKDNHVDQIFSELDELTKEDIIIENTPINSGVVFKPDIPSKIQNYKSFSECIINILKAVNYGTNNSEEYVKGHQEALKKYSKEITTNHKTIDIVEKKLSSEIEKYENQGTLFSKGYYDGLFFVLKSYQKGKNLMMEKIASLL